MPPQVIWFASSYLGGKYTWFVFAATRLMFGRARIGFKISASVCVFGQALQHEPRSCSTSYVTLEISLERESAYHAIREEETGFAQQRLESDLFGRSLPAGDQPVSEVAMERLHRGEPSHVVLASFDQPAMEVLGPGSGIRLGNRSRKLFRDSDR